MNKISVGGFTRISKRAAEKLYNAGKTVRICACKLSPVNSWGMYADANSRDYTTVSTDGFNTTVARNRAFETVVNAFRYYNCSHETGRYPAFYVKEG